MIIRPDVAISNSNNINQIPHNINDESPKDQSISGESKTPMTIDLNNNTPKVDEIKQQIDNNSYKMNIDSTSEKMAQELLPN